MEFIKKYQGYIAIGLAAIGLVALVVLTSNNKEADTSKTGDNAKSTKTDETAANKSAATDKTSSSAAVYSYTAQAGDSYTVLARKAVQTYGINEKVNLTSAQIVAAETNLTVNAGSIDLNEGQTVTVQKSAVKAAVDAAKKLSADELAAWQTYVPSVDFNTNAAGQATTR